ncbi:MAG: hypothetical protein ABIS23_02490 [Sphingomicrobium sp.]
MQDYRLYFLDRLSGHISEVEEFAASADAEAIARAAARPDPRPRELWHRHHKLKHWDESLLEAD